MGNCKQDFQKLSSVKKEVISGQLFWVRGNWVDTLGLDEEKIKKYA